MARLTNPQDNDDVKKAAMKRYVRDCERDGSIFQQPADIIVGRKYVTLESRHRCLTRYEIQALQPKSSRGRLGTMKK